MTFEYCRPATLDDAIAELGEEAALALAGGMGLGPMLNTGLLAPRKLVSLRELPGLRRIARHGDGFEIGALTTHAQIAADPELVAAVPAVRATFGLIGNVRVREWGTIGGNLAHADPAQDPPVLLSALGASVHVTGPDGERVLAVQDLADGPFSVTLDGNELITSVVIPVSPERTSSAYVKFLPRTQDDYATVSAAAVVTLSDDGTVRAARLVLGAVGPTPVACDVAAALLVGNRLGGLLERELLDEVADAVRDAISPATDSRGSAAYKTQVAGVIARRAVERCAAGGADGTHPQ